MGWVRMMRRRPAPWLTALGAMAAAGVAVAVILVQTMTASYRSFEAQLAGIDAAKVGAAYAASLDRIHAHNGDWATWDDTYRFIKGQFPDYIRDNLATSTADEIGIDFLIITDLRLKLVASTGRTGDANVLFRTGVILDALKKQGCFDVRHKNRKGWVGTIPTAIGAYATSVRPVTTSNGKAEPDGWIVFARRVGSSLLKDLSRASKTSVRVMTMNEPEAPRVIKAARGRSGFLLGTTPSTLTLASIVGDHQGRPAAVLLAEAPRTTAAYGRSVLLSTLVGVMVVGGIFSTVVFILIGRLQKVNQALGEQEKALQLHNALLEKEVVMRTQEIEDQASHDPLTGLANRGFFQDCLRRAVESCRSHGPGVGILFIDLDNFKLVNDSLGHDQGDCLLREAAARLATAAGAEPLVSRFGGDEFTVLLRGSRHKTFELAYRLLDALAPPVILMGRQVFPGGSIGVAWQEAGEVDATDLMKMADTAMYRAKQMGKGTVVFYHESMEKDHMERLELEADMRKALELGQIHVLYQPLVETQTGRIIGAEALARWVHPARGLVSPTVFVPVAEETGLISAIGLFVLERACCQAAEWRNSGLGRDFYVNVNVSGRQLVDDMVIFQVAGALKASHLPPEALQLEITENMLIEDSEPMRRRLASIRAKGVRLALDDFGTGFSSLSFLSTFPIDTVKIDKSFIQALDRDKGAEAIVGAISVVARTLEMTVVAEGVETEDQRRAAARHGCQASQGYYFSPPVPADELTRMLEAAVAA